MLCKPPVEVGLADADHLPGDAYERQSPAHSPITDGACLNTANEGRRRRVRKERGNFGRWLGVNCHKIIFSSIANAKRAGIG